MDNGWSSVADSCNLIHALAIQSYAGKNRIAGAILAKAIVVGCNYEART
jgi:hypothetical protein